MKSHAPKHAQDTAWESDTQQDAVLEVTCYDVVTLEQVAPGATLKTYDCYSFFPVLKSSKFLQLYDLRCYGTSFSKEGEKLVRYQTWPEITSDSSIHRSGVKDMGYERTKDSPWIQKIIFDLMNIRMGQETKYLILRFNVASETNPELCLTIITVKLTDLTFTVVCPNFLITKYSNS